MTAITKASVTADTSGLVDGTTVDAADVLNPITDLLNHVKQGRVSVSATDTHVKHLDDAFQFGAGLQKTILNPGGDERIELKGQTAIVPFTVLGGSSGPIDLTSIPTWFEHLRLVVGLRTEGAFATQNLAIRVNGDTTAANYASFSTVLQHSAALTTHEALEGLTGYGRCIAVFPGALAPAGYLGVMYFDFYEYAQTGRPRTCRWQGVVRAGNGSGEIRLTEGWFMWKNTANAINQLTILSEGGNFAAGSGYGLYGVR
jgi:hypothetical protein